MNRAKNSGSFSRVSGPLKGGAAGTAAAALAVLLALMFKTSGAVCRRSYVVINLTNVGIPTTSISHGFMAAPSHVGRIVRVRPIRGTLWRMSMMVCVNASNSGKTFCASKKNSSWVYPLISSSSSRSSMRPAL